MADYFTRFSLALPLEPSQQQYALDLAAKARRHQWDEEPPPDFPESLAAVREDWNFEIEKQGDSLWLHSDNGGIDAVCAFLQHLLRQFNPEGCVGFEWSNDCTQPRTDAYGGGAALVTARKIESMSTAQWLQAAQRHPAQASD